jgi:hypothetical protein
MLKSIIVAWPFVLSSFRSIANKVIDLNRSLNARRWPLSARAVNVSVLFAFALQDGEKFNLVSVPVSVRPTIDYFIVSQT